MWTVNTKHATNMPYQHEQQHQFTFNIYKNANKTDKVTNGSHHLAKLFLLLNDIQTDSFR